MKKCYSVLMLSVCVFVLMCCSGGSTGPADIEMQIWNQLKKGDCKKAVQIMYDNSVNQREDKAQVAMEIAALSEKMEQSLKEMGGIKDVQLVEEEISDDGMSAEVTVKYTTKDGTEEESTSKYVKVDNKWKYKP